jgi:hypothetical protein
MVCKRQGRRRVTALPSDTGLLDIPAYLPRETWLELLEEVGLGEGGEPITRHPPRPSGNRYTPCVWTYRGRSLEKDRRFPVKLSTNCPDDSKRMVGIGAQELTVQTERTALVQVPGMDEAYFAGSERRGRPGHLAHPSFAVFYSLYGFSMT